MKTYTIIRRPAELHWQDVPALAVDECLWLPPADIAMQAQVCYDDAALYVRLSVREQNIRAEHKTPGCMVCEDSCMEFFFCPTAGDDRYFNFEWNPNGQLYLGFGPNRCDSVRLLVQDEQALFAPRPARTADGWELTFRVPVSFVRRFVPDFALTPGTTLRANCFKCGELTPQPHYYSWNPVTSETPDFHRPCDFGQMLLQ